MGEDKVTTMEFTIKPEDIKVFTEPAGIRLKETNERSRILAAAQQAVCGQREQDYGSPEDNFSMIADMWSTYLGKEVTSIDVSMMMILLKIARIKNGGGSGDSFVDIAGYASCGGEIWHGISHHA